MGKAGSARGAAVIRQAIACDICGAEKKETKHWFVALEHGGELRICSWSAQRKTRTGAKHLCGQTCLHRLVDDFMAGTIYGRAPSSFEEDTGQAAPSGRSSAGLGGMDEFESSARLVPTPVSRVKAARPASRPVAPKRVREVGPYAPAGKVDSSMVLVSEGSPTSIVQKSRFGGQPGEPDYPPSGPPGGFLKRPPGVDGAGGAAGHPGMQLEAVRREEELRAEAEPSLQRRRADAWARERARESCQGERPARVQSGRG